MMFFVSQGRVTERRVQKGQENTMEPDNELCEVCEGVFVSSCRPAMDREALDAAGITHVLNAADALLPGQDADPRRVVLCLGLTDRPSTDLSRALPRAVLFVAAARHAGGRVLVHCHTGRSRAGAVAMAYLMKTRGIAGDQALAVLRRARPGVLPNTGFLAQITGWYQAGMPMGDLEADYASLARD